MGMKVGDEGGVKAEPNVVPMIDVMLVLLIIFMVVTPALAQGFKATPPEGINIKTHPEEDTDQVLGIAVDGSYWLNKRPIAEDTLDETIKRIYDARTVDKILYVKADKDLKYKFVAKAMDIAAKNGVRVVGAVSDQKMGTQSTVAGDVIDPKKK
ncbi:MAG TPA: biopolymer transporter ExbD [Gemmatimonadaceae bacterium]|nr:biopolymer transporter ExbD [Gemmatimonadaceae bacterium]